MPRLSAGLVMYRFREGGLQVLLVHPGGPFWKNKDEGVWSIPKGEPDDENADLLETAQREFHEELSLKATPPFIPLGNIQQKGGKIVHAWAFAGDCDPATCKSNTIMIQWPPRSENFIEIPEVDRAEFFNLEVARLKLKPAQYPLLERLAEFLRVCQTPK